MDLYSSITEIKGIGEKKAQAFSRLGVLTLYDLISFFPRRYEDRSVFQKISDTCDGQYACISAIVSTDPVLTRVRKGLSFVKFSIADETGIVYVTYFNQDYVKNNLSKGDEFVFYGKIEVTGRRRCMTNPVYEREGVRDGVTGRIMPVYRLTSGLNQRSVFQSVNCALDACEEFIPDVIPDSVINSQQLARAAYSYRNIHFPSDFTALALARKRLIFEELFVLAVALGKLNTEHRKERGIEIENIKAEEFFDALPFSPTGAQMRAIAEASEDMASGTQMNRLVQGDVGSGKTLVAAALAYKVYKAGCMTAFMAPTEILADQHYQTLGRLLSPFGLHVAKLTGSMTAKEKKDVRKDLADGKIDLIVGTHALFSDDVQYANLALVITDEQHRFGVNQRASLVSKGIRPHVYVMSATPIPRTLALIIYGDLDVSVIDEMPPGRQKVDTFAVDESYRRRLLNFMDKQVKEGHRVFVVCPMVEENEENNLNLKSAEEHAAYLQKLLPSCKVGCVHGRMKPKEKDEIMRRFACGESDILVSTTVIEVGVDVPEATLMVIENAERFGLSQLHQLRGRVGRGKDKSWCILVSDNKSDDVKARFKIMCETNDGFKISEEDLRLRGPGDFFGERQHGLPEMHVADLGTDTATLKSAQDEAGKLLESDPELDTCPELKKRIGLMFSSPQLMS